jgi:hypothetical protein
VRGTAGRARPRLLGAFALACVLVGVGVTVITGQGWATVVGVACMCAGAAAAFVLATSIPDEEAAAEIHSGPDRPGT